MMNATPPLPTGPINAPLATGSLPNGGDDGQAFAQALDQATARQRHDDAETQEAPGRDGAAERPEARPGARAPRRDAAAAQGSRSPLARQAADTEPTPGPAQALVATLSPRVDAGEEDPIPPATDDPTPPAADLAAWVSSLPLPKPADVAIADAAPPAAEAVARAAAPVPAAADAAAVVVPAQLPQGRPFVDALPAGAAAAPRALVSARVAAPGRAAADAADAVQPGQLPQGRPFVDALPAAATAAQAPGLGTAASRHAAQRASHPPSSTTLASAAPSREAGARADAALQGLGFGLEALRAAQPEGSTPAAVAAPTAPGAQAALSALALATLGTARPAEGAAPVQAEVRAPLGSPEFAPALGSQLSVMVREGIDHAQLKLNPAEMGPIEVRISLDGTQAQVDFSAAHAATRQALQDAVPALASALRESGLTLTGGGVFEQARDPRGDARQDRQGPWAGGEPPAADGRNAPLPAARAARSRGVVDLYA